jgi:hypothetical protein
MITTKSNREIKRLARLVVTIKKSIDRAQASWDSGEYIAAFSDVGVAELMFVANRAASRQHLVIAERALAAAKQVSVA